MPLTSADCEKISQCQSNCPTSYGLSSTFYSGQPPKPPSSMSFNTASVQKEYKRIPSAQSSERGVEVCHGFSKLLAFQIGMPHPFTTLATGDSHSLTRAEQLCSLVTRGSRPQKCSHCPGVPEICFCRWSKLRSSGFQFTTSASATAMHALQAGRATWKKWGSPTNPWVLNASRDSRRKGNLQSFQRENWGRQAPG